MIRVENVHKIYPMGKVEVHALRGVSLSIEPGEFLVLKGPSGSGKSTLLNLMGALDVPTEGHIYVNEEDLGSFSPREQASFRRHYVGFVFQNFNLVPELNVYENVEVPLLIRRDRGRREKVMRMVEAVGLAAHLHHRPYELSGGQQQRVAIARALVKEPLLVLADEPTANLDSHTGEEILKLMRELNERLGTTFVIASHDELVMSYAKRVVELKDGVLVGDRTL